MWFPFFAVCDFKDNVIKLYIKSSNLYVSFEKAYLDFSENLITIVICFFYVFKYIYYLVKF